MSILFMGTPCFACLPLKRLIEEERVIAVVTQPDHPSGRGKKLTPPPVKEVAEKENIPIYQPRKVNQPSFIHLVKKFMPDLIVVVAFGQILSLELLSIPKICCINIHPSLLPRYRGPAPIPWAIIKGERETGVTIQKMEEEIDGGAIILQAGVRIGLYDTTKDLEEKLSILGADLFIKAIKRLKVSQANYVAQDEAKVSYAPKIGKAEGEINWGKSSLEIHNLARGLNPYPGAFTFCRIREQKNKIKIWQTELTNEDLPKERRKALSGEIVQIKKGTGFMVRTGDGALLIKKVQLPNRSSISGYDFIKGYQIKEGIILGG